MYGFLATHRFTRLLDSKSSRSARVLEILKAIDGYAGGTSGELKQTKLLHSRLGMDNHSMTWSVFS